MPFTQNLNFCMEKYGYSAYRLAKIVGATNQAVLNWKSGTAIPHPKTRQKIADHFGITLAELDGDDLPALQTKGEKNPPSRKARGDPVTNEIFEFIDSASPEELADTANYIQFLKSKRGSQ